MLQKFEDLEILQSLDTTHGGHTQISIGKYQDRLLVCKVLQPAHRLSKRSLSKTAKV